MALSGESLQDKTPRSKTPGPGKSGAAAEAALVAGARQGDETAWLQLVQAHQQALFRLVYLNLGPSFDAADAEDVTQEAFVRAYLNLDKFDDERPLRPWLLGIAANLARNRRRSAGRYWAAIRRWWRHNEGHAVISPAHEQRSEAHELWQAVQRLSRRAQEVIYLFYFMELSEAETAQALSVPPGTVKSRLYRARRQLRAVIAAEFPALYDEWQEQNESG